MEETMKAITAITVLSILALPGLAPAQPTPEEVRRQRVYVDVVEGNNDFAFALYARLRSSNGQRNIVVSPFSVSTALAMIYAGARAQTEEQMAAVLHFPRGQQALHAAFG